jgi:RNA polymerase sigma-70 factor (ECF subfamily)
MIYSSLSCNELVRACSESENAEAWEEFVCRFGKFITVVLARVARRYGENSSSVIEDLVQETYAKVCNDNCRLLRDFEPQHQDAFFGMLKVTAANVAHDYFRSRRSYKRGSGKVESELDQAGGLPPDPSFANQDRIEREILLQEIDRILISLMLGERDREIFWLHYRQGLTASAIAEIPGYGLTAKGVESILHRLRGQLRARLATTAALAGARSRAKGIPQENALSRGDEQP